MSVTSRVSEHYRSGDPSQLTPMEIALSRCSWCPSVSEVEPELEGDSTSDSWIDEPHGATDDAIDQPSSSLETDHRLLGAAFEEETERAIGEVAAID